MWRNSYVRCSKVDVVKEAKCPTPHPDDYRYGESNRNMSVPVDYWVTGYLVTEPKVGDGICIQRDSRNGVKTYGTFKTSRIKGVEKMNDHKLKVETNNSVYLLEKN